MLVGTFHKLMILWVKWHVCAVLIGDRPEIYQGREYQKNETCDHAEKIRGYIDVPQIVNYQTSNQRKEENGRRMSEEMCKVLEEFHIYRILGFVNKVEKVPP